MRLPDKIQYFGLPIFYEIKLKNGKTERARFDNLKNIWLTQGKNKKIEINQVEKWRFFWPKLLTSRLDL